MSLFLSLEAHLFSLLIFDILLLFTKVFCRIFLLAFLFSYSIIFLRWAFLLASFLWARHAFSARPHKLTDRFDVPFAYTIYLPIDMPSFEFIRIFFFLLLHFGLLCAINLLHSANWQSHECAQLIRWQLTHVCHAEGGPGLWCCRLFGCSRDQVAYTW